MRWEDEMSEAEEMNKKDLSILDSFKIIFTRKRLGEEAALEHIKNNESN